MNEWFEDESFWIDMYPYMFPAWRFEIATEEIEKILKLSACSGGSILDLCCGPGRHSIALAKKGFTVSGIDRTLFLIEKARERARKENVTIDWVLGDMRRFVRPSKYDLILNMFTSFGYFDKKEEDMQVLQNVFQSLKPNGMFLLDIFGKERLVKSFQTTTSSKEDDGTIILERHEIFDNWSRIRNEWILIKNETAKSFHFHHTIYSGQEIKDRLLQVGFKEVKLFGDLDGSAYGPDAKRLIAVARKE